MSTPTVGGHYLVDLIAGVAIAVAAIALLHRIGWVNASWRPVA
jgi:membrane-associated phospholipid phosphatase